jgi:tRNA A-37 threonylcarbamoyl transferase component Bud32
MDVKTTNKICIPLTEYITGDHTENNIQVKTRITTTEGAFGEIWQACESIRNRGLECKYILKYQPFRDADEAKGLPAITRDSIIKEATLQNEISKFGLAPPIKDSWICKTGGVIVMPSLKMTVYALFKIYDSIDIHYLILARCLSLIKRLHEVGYYHGDSSISNIMVDYSASDLRDASEEDTDISRYKTTNYRYYFIDMGFSERLKSPPDPEMIERDYQIFAISLQEKYDLGKNDNKNFGPLIEFMSEFLKK